MKRTEILSPYFTDSVFYCWNYISSQYECSRLLRWWYLRSNLSARLIVKYKCYGSELTSSLFKAIVEEILILKKLINWMKWIIFLLKRIQEKNIIFVKIKHPFLVDVLPQQCHAENDKLPGTINVIKISEQVIYGLQWFKKWNKQAQRESWQKFFVL